jgi:hypothetical protein
MALTRRSTTRLLAIPVAIIVSGCSSNSTSGESDSGAPDGSRDASTTDTTAQDSGQTDSGTLDSTTPDSTAVDSATSDSATLDSGTSDSGTSDTSMPDASDGSCPVAWLTPPAFSSSLDLPVDAGGVLLHGAGSGTQNYACEVGDAGTSWVLVTPSATLDDCSGAVLAHHFASDGGAAFPEWQAPDGTYVVGHKVAAFTPDGGAESIPWVLLQAVGHGGSGPLSEVTYVQRLDTDGGAAPAGSCEAGVTQDVPYSAEYYFYAP